MARNRPGDDLPKAKLNKENLKKATRIFSYLKPFAGKYSLGLLFLFLTSITALVFPYILGDLVDGANNANPTASQINKLALTLMGILVLQSVFSFFRIFLFVDVTESMLASLRQATYNKLISLPMLYFSQKRVGELNSRISSDISQLQETFTTTLAEFLRQFILIIGGLGMLAFTSIKLTGVMLAIVPIVAIAAVIFGRYIRKVSKQVQDKIAESNTIVEETMQGIATVKAYANEAFEVLRYGKSTKDIKDVAMVGARWRGAFASFIIFCLFGSIVAVIWVAMLLVESGEMSYGEMFRFLLLSVFVGASIGGIAELYAQIQKSIGSTERIMEIIDETGEDVTIDVAQVQDNLELKGSVEFENVSFNYPTRPDVDVLKNISFKANQGDQIAIVGPSGSGKSTIVSLLLRFYESQAGTVKIDGKLASNYNLTALRRRMAVVPQDVLLFGGSIRENIAYGRPNASDEEILEAAQKANAIEFIDRFPEGLNTLVGERGVQLSGGQKQRIAIARAVLKNPSILILDEATSSLDSESERLVQEALEKLMQGRTSLVIAHRLSTIRNADKILVIENGVIKEAGKHDDLLKIDNGLYRSLSQLQFSSFN